MSETTAIMETGVMGAEEEARSALGTVLAQILTAIRNIISWAMNYVSKLVAWMGENPKYATMFLANLLILFS